MSLSNFNLPLFLKIDYDTFPAVGHYIKQYCQVREKVLVVTDSLIEKLYADTLVTYLQKDFSEVEKHIIYDNSLSEASKISYRVISNDNDLVIGIGGGRVLDVAKYASFMCKKTFVSIPTAIAHDGLASPIAVLKCDSDKTKSLGCRIPSGIIVDLKIIKSSPTQLIKAGIGDILSNKTAIYDWKLANTRVGEPINDFALLLSNTAVNSILNFKHKDLGNLEFLYQLCEAVVLSGLAMEIAGTSRPCSGSEHLFSHALDQYTTSQNLHGIQVALGAIISSYMQGQDYQQLIEFLQTFGIPTHLVTIGISEEDYLTAMLNARSTRKGRYTIFDEYDLSMDNLKEVYRKIF